MLILLLHISLLNLSCPGYFNFKTKVESIWNAPCHAESAFDRIQLKLKKLKQYFKGWGFNLQGERKKRKQMIQTEIHNMDIDEENGPLSSSQLMRRADLKCELLSILEEEELYWFKRSHETWLHKGDNNTEYFHRIANGRKRKNTIFHLKDGNNVVVGDKILLEHATLYYKTLFCRANNNVLPLEQSFWDEVTSLSPEDNELLCKPFLEGEIKEALFQMEKNKAAGPDGIPIEFFQTCWEIVKKDIIEMFDDFHKGNLDVSRINYGIITLLPKTMDADRMQQYRPICLLNCLYKWITKVLTIRMTPYAEKLICQEQTAFMKGRNIMSGIMALHEILHETKKRGKIGVIL